MYLVLPFTGFFLKCLLIVSEEDRSRKPLFSLNACHHLQPTPMIHRLTPHLYYTGMFAAMASNKPNMFSEALHCAEWSGSMPELGASSDAQISDG